MHNNRSRAIGVSGLMMAIMGAAGLHMAIPPKLELAPIYTPRAERSTYGRRYGSRGRVYPRQSARQAARYAAKSGLTVFRQEEKPKAVNVGDIWVSVRYPWQYSRAEGVRKTWKAVV